VPVGLGLDTPFFQRQGHSRCHDPLPTQSPSVDPGVSTCAVSDRAAGHRRAARCVADRRHRASPVPITQYRSPSTDHPVPITQYRSHTESGREQGRAEPLSGQQKPRRAALSTALPGGNRSHRHRRCDRVADNPDPLDLHLDDISGSEVPRRCAFEADPAGVPVQIMSPGVRVSTSLT
jgi:hypothetical protein